MFSWCIFSVNFDIFVNSESLGFKLPDLTSLRISPTESLTDFFETDFLDWSVAEIERCRDGFYSSNNLSHSRPILIKLKVTEKYDSTGVAIIYEHQNPYFSLKSGDFLKFK